MKAQTRDQAEETPRTESGKFPLTATQERRHHEELMRKPTVREMAAVRITTADGETAEPKWLPTLPPQVTPASQRTPGSTAYASDAFADEDERQTGRFDVVESPASVPPPRELPVLVRMDGHCAGAVISIPAEGSVLGRSPSSGLHIDDVGVSRQHARVYLEDGQAWLEDLGSQNGSYVSGRGVSRAKLQDGDWVQLGPRVSFRYSLMDTQQKSVLERLYESSILDPLTGAHNRRHGDERLTSEVAYALRHRSMLSVMLLDLDHFKRINDEHGHQAGDAVLQHFAQLARRELRAEDVFSRYGGEEFLVIVRGIDLNGAFCAAERIRVVLAQSPVMHAGKPIQVTLSAGCASLECVTEPCGRDLVSTADARLYAAKASGRNRVVIDDP